MFNLKLSRREFVALAGAPLIARASAGGVEATTDEDVLRIKDDGRTAIEFLLRPKPPNANIRPAFLRAGYLHPVYTPSGKIVTGDYPDDHLHQHGIFFAWTKTEFEGRHPDFWNMGDGTGKVELDKIDSVYSGAEKAGFKARLRHIDLSAPQPKTALNETWEVTVYRTVEGSRRYTMFDVVSTQACATSSPLVLPDYRYGGIGIRGHNQWRTKSNVSFLTSEGKDRLAGDDTTARWCAIGGRVDGQPAGLAALSHPSNFRAPQPLRIHPDDPYFNFSPSKRGEWEIAPGKAYVSRYRFLTYDGEPDREDLDRFWNAYAKS